MFPSTTHKPFLKLNLRAITTLAMGTSEAAARGFFTAPYFAVVGASSDPTKFGHKSIFSPTLNLSIDDTEMVY
jgi:hypothetical protein